MTLERKSGSLSIWFFNSWHKVKRVIFGPVWAAREQTSRQRVSVQIHSQNPLTGTPAHTCSLWYLDNCVPTILVDFFSNFFDILVGTTCWRAPRMRMIFNAHFSSFEPRKPLKNLSTVQRFLLKGFWSISCAYVAVFPRRKQNLKHIRCSVRSDITISREELDNTCENWQHTPYKLLRRRPPGYWLMKGATTLT